MMAFLRGLWRNMMGMFGARYEEEPPQYTFYDSLEGFGYHFNEKGELRDSEGGRFKFVVREGDRSYNQQHYDALGEVITEYLYNIMEKELQLEKVYIPTEAPKVEPQTFIFKSKNALENDKLMVLIHGSGAVRAGQWSRKLIINEDIDTGSQLPYIRRALEDGYGVIVLNPNLNEQKVNGKNVKIRGSGSPEEHGVYVWENFVTKAKAESIVIVAHSYGGIVTCATAESFLEDFKKRVFSIVFTDSVHSAGRGRWSDSVKEFMKERAVNFASAYLPLDTQLMTSHAEDCMSISAGTEEHERTSHSCIDSAFKFIRENFNTWTKDRTMAPHNFLPLPENLDDYSPARRWERRQREEEEVAAKRKEDEQKIKEEEEKKKDSSVDSESPAKNGGAQAPEKDVQEMSSAGAESKGASKEKMDDEQDLKLSSNGEQGKESSPSEQGAESKETGEEGKNSGTDEEVKSQPGDKRSDDDESEKDDTKVFKSEL